MCRSGSVCVFYYEKPKRNNISFLERSFPFTAPQPRRRRRRRRTATETVAILSSLSTRNLSYTLRSFLMTAVRGFSLLTLSPEFSNQKLPFSRRYPDSYCAFNHWSQVIGHRRNFTKFQDKQNMNV